MKLTGLNPNTLLLGLKFRLILGPTCTYVIEWWSAKCAMGWKWCRWKSLQIDVRYYHTICVEGLREKARETGKESLRANGHVVYFCRKVDATQSVPFHCWRRRLNVCSCCVWRDSYCVTQICLSAGYLLLEGTDQFIMPELLRGWPCTPLPSACRVWWPLELVNAGQTAPCSNPSGHCVSSC